MIDVYTSQHIFSMNTHREVLRRFSSTRWRYKPSKTEQVVIRILRNREIYPFTSPGHWDQMAIFLSCEQLQYSCFSFHWMGVSNIFWVDWRVNVSASKHAIQLYFVVGFRELISIVSANLIKVDRFDLCINGWNMYHYGASWFVYPWHSARLG